MRAEVVALPFPSGNGSMSDAFPPPLFFSPRLERMGMEAEALWAFPSGNGSISDAFPPTLSLFSAAATG